MNIMYIKGWTKNIIYITGWTMNITYTGSTMNIIFTGWTMNKGLILHQNHSINSKLVNNNNAGTIHCGMRMLVEATRVSNFSWNFARIWKFRKLCRIWTFLWRQNKVRNFGKLSQKKWNFGSLEAVDPRLDLHSWFSPPWTVLGAGVRPLQNLVIHDSLRSNKHSFKAPAG